MYDIIGDIHGHYNELVLLLKKMGYRHTSAGFTHPGRKVIFVGDFVDRGPRIRETLHLVKQMTDAGNALTVMGNHEYNALCYHRKGPDGSYLRAHSEKNYKQHQHTLQAFAEYPEEWEHFLDWFKQMPLFLDLEGIRIIHASWVKSNIEWVRKNLPENKLNEEFLVTSSQKGTMAFQVVENLLKGLELPLPEGAIIQDKEGKHRSSIRIKWWITPEEGITYNDIAMKYRNKLDAMEVPRKELALVESYSARQKPVFTGHYWLSGEPQILRENISCTDYSVAKGGKLVAYRWSGEQKLSNAHFVSVPSEANTDFP